MPPTPEQLARSGTEAAHQTALFCWAALNQETYPELKLMFHIPNGGTRDRVEAGHLKAQGVKSGVPDICLPFAVYPYHALWIELKVGKNKLSDNQDAFCEQLKYRNYAIVVCYSWFEAMNVIISYLKGTYQNAD